MTITSADLLAPVGPVDARLFPGEETRDIAVRLDQYIANGYADERVAAQTDAARKDLITQAYALHQVFTAVYIRLSTEPTTVSVTEKGSHTYVAEQIRNIKGLADKYLADFNGLLIIAPASQPSKFPPTMSLRNTVEW